MENFRIKETEIATNGNGVVSKSFLQKTKDDLIEMIVREELIPNVILMSKANLDKFRSLKSNLTTFSGE